MAVFDRCRENLLLLACQLTAQQNFRCLSGCCHGDSTAVQASSHSLECSVSAAVCSELCVLCAQTCVLLLQFVEAIVVLIRQTSHLRVTRALRPIFLVDCRYCGAVRRYIMTLTDTHTTTVENIMTKRHNSVPCSSIQPPLDCGILPASLHNIHVVNFSAFSASSNGLWSFDPDFHPS